MDCAAVLHPRATKSKGNQSWGDEGGRQSCKQAWWYKCCACRLRRLQVQVGASMATSEEGTHLQAGAQGVQLHHKGASQGSAPQGRQEQDTERPHLPWEPL